MTSPITNYQLPITLFVLIGIQGSGKSTWARANAQRVAVFGSAVHAETQLKAMAAVRDLTEVRVYSSTAAHCQSFAERMSRELAVPVIPTTSAQEALADADMIITATSAKTPVFDGSWLKAGTHITSIANGDKTRVRQELDETSLCRADPIFVTSKATVCVNESDIFRAVRDRVITWDRVHEISSLLLGQVAGRQDDQQITLFKLQGTGIMDVAIGRLAYERLKGSNLAQRL